MEKLSEVIEGEIRDRVASLFYRDRIHEGRKMKDVAEFVGVAPSGVQKWRDKKATPGSANIVALAKFFNVSPLWILTGEEEKHPPQNGNGKIAGEIRDKSLLEVEKWIMQTNDGLDYGPMIKGLVAKEYPEFREWLKKTAKEGDGAQSGDMGENSNYGGNF